MSHFIVDTNVWLVASGKSHESVECMEACYQFLETLKESAATVVLDAASFEDESPPGNSVLQELKQNWSEQDYAYQLFWRHFYDLGFFEIVDLKYDEQGAVWPEGIDIRQAEENGKRTDFEPADRKWVALHLQHPDHPPIYNASDGDWRKAQEDLERHGIVVRDVCREAKQRR